MIGAENFGWGITIHTDEWTTTIVWPDGVGLAGPGMPDRWPAGDLRPPADRSQAWYYQHPGPYVNVREALPVALKRLAELWDMHGLSARQAKYLSDICDPNPWVSCMAHEFSSPVENAAPPARVKLDTLNEIAEDRFRVGWHPLLPFVNLKQGRRIYH